MPFVLRSIISIPCLCLFVALQASLALADTAPQTGAQIRRIPTYNECQKLASAKTPAPEKAQLTQLFKTNGMYCAMLTPPIMSQNMFSGGQVKSQLRLTMGSSNTYVIDRKSLLDTLAPDRAAIPPAQMVMLAGQIISILGEVFSNGIDPSSAHHMASKASAFTGILGNNARAALVQLDNLRGQMRLSPDDIQESFWLKKCAAFEPAPMPTTQNANAAMPAVIPGAPAGTPPWMQKLLGAGQHIFGSFQMSGE